MLTAQRGFEATADVAVVGPALKVLDADLAFEVGPCRAVGRPGAAGCAYARWRPRGLLRGVMRGGHVLELPDVRCLGCWCSGRCEAGGRRVVQVARTPGTTAKTPTLPSWPLLFRCCSPNPCSRPPCYLMRSLPTCSHITPCLYPRAVLPCRCAALPARPKRRASRRRSMRPPRRRAACWVRLAGRGVRGACSAASWHALKNVVVSLWTLPATLFPCLPLQRPRTPCARCRAEPAAGAGAGRAVWRAERAAGPAAPRHHKKPDCLPGSLGPPPRAVRPDLPGKGWGLGGRLGAMQAGET